ncbi:Mitochondrial distribution and morphology protein 12 [Xanthoria parietina]
MSIDIDWAGLTTGPEGLALAESIRDFINEKFQSVQLPRFIRSVEVHSFHFGDEAPVVELKDLGDPLAEFYEDGDSESGEHEDQEVNDGDKSGSNRQQEVRSDDNSYNNNFRHPAPPSILRPTPLDSTRFSRSSTPGIPGGISNLSYFHLPLSSTGLSGTTTPLAAVAGGNAGWGGGDLHAYPPFTHIRQHSPVRQTQPQPPRRHSHADDNDPSSRPSTADNYAQAPHPSSSSPPPASKHTDTPSSTDDLQIVLHISYTGNVKLSMTAEILLDYPMPSFVGIPLKLNITGLSFDGVAIVAYLRHRAHFCFLGEEDARTLIGADVARDRGKDEDGDRSLGGLLREIRVESEIGRQEDGKQVLRNVGKVEKFVLEQVRRIFEEEFVWPSFWTFLV